MSHINVFAGGDLDRLAPQRRDPDFVAELAASAGSVLTVVWRSRSLVAVSDPPRPLELPLAEHRHLLAEGHTPVLLGVRGNRAYFAADLSALDEPLETLNTEADVAEFQDLRPLGAMLEASQVSMLAYARAMMTWHARHRFCGSCGHPTRSTHAGHQRDCTNEDCGDIVFPRTDPAVIMLVARGDQCLLGRQASWPEGVYSTLAGFVEPGESLEEAVAREVREETGVLVRDSGYHSSQPWPFPSSIMLGFLAEAASEQIDLHDGQLADARWSSRQDVLERRVRLPPRLSIARQLIEAWLRSR